MKILFRSVRALTLPAFIAALVLQLAPNSHAQPDVVGQWGAVENWPIVSVHSVLLPTGKVMFYPYGDDPYLWDPANSSVTQLPRVGYNIFCTGHSILADGASISSVTWLRLSAVTHTMNMDQRINRLAFSQTTGGLNVTAPGNVNLCPPGHYMLFVMNGNGVPSVSRMVRISNFWCSAERADGFDRNSRYSEGEFIVE